MVLDSYDYAEALKKAKVPEDQIRVEVARDKERTKAFNEIINNNLATKKNIEDLRVATKNDLESSIAIVKRDIIIWLGSIVIIVGGIITTILGHLISLINLSKSVL